MELFKKTQEENAETAMFFGDVFLNAHVGKKVMANNIQYFLRLNDPTKPEKFVGAIISAIIAYAIQMMKKAGQHSARPASIHQFLIARSKQSAMAMSLFKCLCDYETVILVRRVERLKNFDAYQSSLRLSLPLFATRHATSYMRIVSDLLFLLWRGSLLELKLIRDHCFTAKTEGRKNNIGKDWLSHGEASECSARSY
jgi:hypothetical protein